jgi:hypothetical protein
MADEKKIIIDEDWKKQAQQEKEILKEKEKAEHEQTATEEPEASERGPLPEADMASLINMLTTQALFAMGVLHVKGQEDHPSDLQLAKYNIDMLEVLQEKTKGNLSEDEVAALKNTLNELRMGFVQIANQGPPQVDGAEG